MTVSLEQRVCPFNFVRLIDGGYPSGEDHLAGPQRSVTELCVWIGIRTVRKFNEWKSLILVGGGAGLKTRSCAL